MKGLIILAMANISRKKAQSIILGLTIAVTTLLFSTSTGLLTSLDSPIEKMFSNQKGAHILAEIDHDLYDADMINQWWKNYEGTESLYMYNALPKSQSILPIWIEDEKTSINVWAFERPADLTIIDRLVFIEGVEKPCPDPGEIWLPHIVSGLLDLSIGDVIYLPMESGKEKFTISAFVVDPQFNGTTINPRRVWIAPGTLSLYTPPSRLRQSMLAVHLKSPDILKSAWKEFQEFMHGSYSGIVFKHYSILFSYSLIYRLIAVILLFFSFISMIITLIIIKTTISGSIYAQFRQIGILKAVGYTNGGVRSAFVLKYLILCLFAMPVSIIASFYLIPAALSMVAGASGVVVGTQAFGPVIFAAALAYLIVITVIALLSAGKGAKINTVEAIRFGNNNPGSKRRFYEPSHKAIKTAPLVPALSTLMISDKKGRFFSNTVMILIFGVAVFTFATLSNSMKHFGSNLPPWGINDADVMIVEARNSNSTSDFTSFKQMLMKFPEVENSIAGSTMTGSYILGDDTDSNLNIHVYSLPVNALGLECYLGRNPEKADEIALATKSAVNNGLKIGDSLTLVIYGTSYTYTLTGVYQSIDNLGIGGLMTVSGLRRADPHFILDTHYVKLYEETDTDSFIRKIEGEYGSLVNAKDYRESLQENISGYTSAINALLMLILIIIGIISSVIIYNAVITEINERHRALGIFKVLGLKNVELRLAMLLKSLITTIISVSLSVLLGSLLAGPILNILMGSLTGMPQFPVIFSGLSVFLIFVFFLTISTVSTWLPSGKVKTVDPRSLIME